MKINKQAALEILEEAVANTAPSQLSPKWTAEVVALANACGRTNLTFIAALGTALLAKSVESSVDVCSLKAGDSPTGYSARSLCKDVLAANAERLGIDLGVTGREPLNNQPFYAEERITRALPVRPAARGALNKLVDILEKLDTVDSSEAQLALRSFIASRSGRVQQSQLFVAREDLALDRFLEAVEAHVGQDSELGKRAQAVSAGMLDMCFGQERVETSRIHDPDRRFPGDVRVVSVIEGKARPDAVFEVRDKPVVAGDIDHFLTKVKKAGVSRAGVLALGRGQGALDILAASDKAAKDGITLVVFTSWRAFIYGVLFWSEGRCAELLSRAGLRVLERAKQLEVSEAGRNDWVQRMGLKPAARS